MPITRANTRASEAPSAQSSRPASRASENAEEALTANPREERVRHAVPDLGTHPQTAEDKFAEALTHAFSKAIRSAPASESAAKYRVPDSFDGTDPYKLRNFLTQCEIYFRANPNKFRSDEKKVMFAFSYLAENALEWFEQKFETAKSTRPSFGVSASQDSDAEDDDFDDEGSGMFHTAAPARRPGPNDWVSNWELFVHEIKLHFGPADDEAEAERRLTHLSMPSDKRIIWYNLRFNRYSIRTGWDDRALCYRYYEGLPDRLQDAITSDGKPKSLEKMKALAIKWDQRYWERQGEKKKSADREKKAPRSDSGNPSSSNHQSSSSASTSRSTHQQKSDKPPKTSSSTATTPNFLDGKLGKDGKLTQAERTRRMENNLCLFCGLAGHRAKDCKKAMKARAASAGTSDTPATEAASGKA